MKINCTIKLIILLLTLVMHTNLSAQYLVKVKPEKVGMSSKRLELLTHTLQEYVKRNKLSGGLGSIINLGL